ncbi:alpha/beta fold hydrolase [Streptomyces antibioticus]|uniref:Alpha/beta hydrolase n=1 Tax=Streptomyces antibioticus TaxID=1890 RepID=A0AAE6YFG4_STRAT|nr:alpha/beta hydrolase [Streptomyces antibioticus]MCX5166483.1 alpha/beta hydrolase [Streptomyces antibioticus]QIT48656.1 alpha/beta hydrolase [Streptomyces antibioticus]
MNRRSLSRRARTPMTLMATATVAAALFAASVGPASAGKAPSPQHRKPTVVLVHGAFADSTSWNGVIAKLKHEGYPVIAPANPLRGLSSDAAYLKELLASIDGPVVLAGHSYGGSVISNAAKGADNVKALVYVAAFLPEKGESAVELSGKFPGSTLGDALRPVPITQPDGKKGADLYIEPSKFHHQFAADVPKSTTDLMAVTQRPVTNAALEEGASEPAWKTIPSWVLVATQDLNIPPKVQEFMAERAKAHVVKVRASHAVSVSHPKDVAGIIESAAHSVR